MVLGRHRCNRPQLELELARGRQVRRVGAQECERRLVVVVAGASALALVVTLAFRIETRGRALDAVSGAELARLRARPTPP